MRTMLLSAAATVAALFLCGTAVADPASSRDQADRELAEAEATMENATEEAREAARELSRLEKELPAARDRLATATGVVAAAEALARSAEETANTSRAEHDAAVIAAIEAGDNVVAARDELTNLAVISYQGGPLRGFNSVIRADNPFDTVERASYVRSFLKDQSEALDAVLILQQAAAVARSNAAGAKEAADEASEAAQTALEAARAERDNAVQAESDLGQLIDAESAALAVAESERDASLARYEEALKVSEEIAAQLSAVSGNDPSPVASQLGFVMPVNGWKSSDFGNRFDPYYHVWQLHAGTDFAADGGEPIRAVASGEVVQAGWNGGYGNFTCVYHGDGLATCYAHQSSIGVTAGQRVSQGQEIGRVGTTGASTGNHLHFEVRVGGKPVDPLGWLPSCLC